MSPTLRVIGRYALSPVSRTCLLKFAPPVHSCWPLTDVSTADGIVGATGSRRRSDYPAVPAERRDAVPCCVAVRLPLVLNPESWQHTKNKQRIFLCCSDQLARFVVCGDD